MEKLVYLLGKPAGREVAELAAEMRRGGIERLRSAGASRIRLGIADERVAPAEALRMGALARDTWCYVALWVRSRTRHPAVKAALQALAGFVHGYAVAESEQLPRDFSADGERVAGMNQVVLFRALAGLGRGEFLGLWLDSHTRIAIDTQSSFGYVQQIVGDRLDEDSPRYDAIVEENFPAGAMSSRAAFYDAVGEPAKLERNEAAMMASVARFIDLDSVERMPMSEYNF